MRVIFGWKLLHTERLWSTKFYPIFSPYPCSSLLKIPTPVHLVCPHYVHFDFGVLRCYTVFFRENGVFVMHSFHRSKTRSVTWPPFLDGVVHVLVPNTSPSMTPLQPSIRDAQLSKSFHSRIVANRSSANSLRSVSVIQSMPNNTRNTTE